MQHISRQLRDDKHTTIMQSWDTDHTDKVPGRRQNIKLSAVMQQYQIALMFHKQLSHQLHMMTFTAEQWTVQHVDCTEDWWKEDL